MLITKAINDFLWSLAQKEADEIFTAETLYHDFVSQLVEHDDAPLRALIINMAMGDRPYKLRIPMELRAYIIDSLF